MKNKIIISPFNYHGTRSNFHESIKLTFYYPDETYVKENANQLIIREYGK